MSGTKCRPITNASATPKYVDKEPRAVAVVRSRTGNHEAESIVRAPKLTGPAKNATN